MKTNPIKTQAWSRSALGRLCGLTLATGVLIAPSLGMGQAATMTHRYSFAADASDSVDLSGAWNGTLNGDASISGGQLVLDGTANTTVSLPPGILNGYYAVTVEAWASFPSGLNNASLWTFGHTDANGWGDHYISMFPHSGSNAKISVTQSDPGWNGELAAGTGPVLDGQTNVHIVGVWDPVDGYESIYVNGVFAGSTPETYPMSNIKSDLNFIGHNNYNGDPYQVATVDEFRIYSGALPGRQIAIDAATGPNNIVTSAGTLNAVHLAVATNQTFVGMSQSAIVTGDFDNVTGVNLLTYGSSVSFVSGNTNVLTVDASGNIKAKGPGTTTITASVGALNSLQTITVSMLPTVMTHRYDFNTDGVASDALNPGGAWDGTLNNYATVSGGQVYLASSLASTVQFPSGILNGYYAVTIETWASFNTEGNWASLFAFGDTSPSGNGRYAINLSPHSGLGDSRLSIADGDPGYNDEQDAAAPGTLDLQQNVHIVAVIDPVDGYESLYLNGVLAGINTNVTIPMSNIKSIYNFIGHDTYNGDPYLDGSVDEFRIYSGPLAASQIALNAASGPNNIVTNPGALLALHLAIQTNQTVVGLSQSATVTGDFANISGVNLITYGSSVSLVSGNTNVLTVDASGNIKAKGPGTTTVTASVGALNSVQTITVSMLPTVLTHRYSFTTDASDSVDLSGAWNGTLNGDASISGGQLVLDGTANTTVSLPSGILNGYYAVTVEAWASFPSGLNNASLWTFGHTDANGWGDHYISMFPHSGSNAKISVTQSDPGWNGELAAGTGPVLDGQTNVHIVGVWDPVDGYESIYVNGVFAGSTAEPYPMSNIKSDLNFIGHNNYNGDPYQIATVDEFRIYSGPLSSSQIAIDFAAGPNSVVTNAGALLAAHLAVATNAMLYGSHQNATVTGDFSNVSGVNLFAYGATITFASSNPNVVSIDAAGSITATGPGTATVSATVGSVSATQTITVSVQRLAMAHRYSFTTDASDSLNPGGAWDGTLYGGAVISGGQLVLDPSLQSYAQLPSGILSNYDSVTIEVWASFAPTVGTWAELCAFGNQNSGGAGMKLINIVPHSGASPSDTRIAIGDGNPAYNHEQEAAAPGVLDGKSNVHIVAVFDPPAGYEALYINDVLKATNNNVTIPMANIDSVVNFIGRSLYNGDAYFGGSIDELRIYSGPMLSAQVAAGGAAGPNVLVDKPTLQVSRAGGNLVVSWPAWALGYTLQSANSLAAGTSWSAVGTAPVLNGNAYQVTVGVSTTARFFRLVQ